MQITENTILTVYRPKDKDPWRLSQLTRSLLQCYCNVIRQTSSQVLVMKWNECGFTPQLFTYRLNWARPTSWGWWYGWGDTALQTHDSKLSPVGLRPSTLSLCHVGCSQYSIFTIEQGGNILFFKTWMPKQETNLRSLTFQAGTSAPALWYCCHIYTNTLPDYWYQDDVLCILASIYKLISKTVPIIDFYDIDDVLYWIKYNFYFIFYMCR